MTDIAADARIDALLEGLNPPQREAVTHGDGPLLILAGAGSGKTRVLTHRIAYLIHAGRARADELIAITFTNKAAQEMRDRVELLLGRSTRGMWVLTFHSACTRMLRVEAPRLGYTRQFTIYDQADSRRLVKQCLDHVGADPKRFSPAAVQSHISDAKNRLRDAAAYRALVSSYFEQTVADTYELYERELVRFNAMDFDDLLLRAVNVLELFPEVRERYQQAFRHVLVDEYQDTNHAQYRWLVLLAGERRNLAVVGDDAQCLIEGTLVTMADGSRRPIEEVAVGDEVRSGYGSGDFGPAKVLRTHRSIRSDGIAIKMRSGRVVVSTPEHVHFAGYLLGRTRQSSVADQRRLHRLFGELDTAVGGTRLLADSGLSLDRPHFQSGTYTATDVRRRRLAISLCGDRRGRTPMHRIALFGYDAEGRRRLEDNGFSVRPARPGSDGWRFETACKDMATIDRVASEIAGVLDNVAIRPSARLGSNLDEIVGNSLPFTCASAVRPGMAMFDEHGDYDIVESVEQVRLDQPVYDLDIESTHNFVANGLVTHNSIYGFRGADIRNILDFEDDFPDAHVVKLEQNYRSTQTILSAANAVISHNRNQVHKDLWTALGPGDPIQIRALADEHAEARAVLSTIEGLVEEGVARSEVAVFYRTNAQSRVLEDALVRGEVPYQVIGGTKFYERAEIKDAVAYLSLLANPSDQVSFTRIANSPRRGIGQTSLSRVIAYAATLDEPVFHVAAAADTVPGLGAAAVRAIGRFMETMGELRALAADGAAVAELLEAVLTRTGYLEALDAERTFEAQGRIENLEELVGVAREFDSGPDAPSRGAGGEGGLDAFLAQIALLSDADGRSDDRGLVTLMTLHNAKGLEYPIVFMIGCEEGVFPHSRALDEGSLEEERRLCYVGMTRAMRSLTLTYARRRALFGAESYGVRSRFLDEIPVELTDADEDVFGSGTAPIAAARGGAGLWAAASAGGLAAEREHAAAAAPRFRIGEDVAHATFGEGVVTGLEPGGIVVVRFAADGSERKLLAGIAPVRSR